MKIPKEPDLLVSCDISPYPFAEAKEIMSERHGTEPISLHISPSDQLHAVRCEIDIPEVCVHPSLPSDAWYIEDSAGNEVWGSVGS